MKQLITTLFLLAAVVTANAQESSLKFREDGKFKIVQITDTHCILDKMEKSEPAFTCVNEVLDAEKPDLVIFTGDVIYGSPAEEGMRAILEMASSRNIPFAVTFGNHDDECGLSRAQLLKIIQTIPHNLTYTVEGITGYSNFTLAILSSGKKPHTAAVIYCFDSHSYSKVKDVKGYDFIKPDQICWYRSESEKFTQANAGTPLLSLAFMHIPICEYVDAVTSMRTPIYGTKREGIGCSEFNSGLFANFLEMGDVKGVFSGHEHDNDFVIDWRGILLGYGRYSGGNTVYNHIPNGARVIELTEGSDSFDTWVRLTDGTILDKVNYPHSFGR